MNGQRLYPICYVIGIIYGEELAKAANDLIENRYEDVPGAAIVRLKQISTVLRMDPGRVGRQAKLLDIAMEEWAHEMMLP